MITRKNDSDITIEMIECAKTRLNDLYTISVVAGVKLPKNAGEKFPLLGI